MIFLQRRRLLIWLIKAYLKKWGKVILLFFFLGLLAFFVLYSMLSKFSNLYLGKKEVVGILGTYTSNNLPGEILSNISIGLTSVSADGKPEPGAAKSWKIDDGGKVYTFYLRKDLNFTDGTKLSSKEINYNFENVAVDRPNQYTIIFKLKENYSPFLITVSRPIFRNNFIGLGDFKLRSIDFNGDFVNSIQIENVKGPNHKITYLFYPTENSLKTALILGEITKTYDISNLAFKDKSLDLFESYTTQKIVNYSKLATLFYNTQDKILSDKKIRQALTYAIPNEFNEGKRNRTPYPPTLWADAVNQLPYDQDFDHARLLLDSSSASSSSKPTIKIETFPQYKNAAKQISLAWAKIGVVSSIEETDSLPSNYQVFIGEFYVSRDPDQYTLWHSDQPNNLTGYKNLRIDKLLEDGRQTIDIGERQKIYADFQKYLLDDSPAAFLFFPYNYVLTKK